MPDCYDHAGQVVWNASASELWRRTTIAIDRALTRHARMHGGRVRLSFGKVAEYQRRGLVHYHALIRLDGLDPATGSGSSLRPAGRRYSSWPMP